MTCGNVRHNDKRSIMDIPSSPKQRRDLLATLISRAQKNALLPEESTVLGQLFPLVEKDWAYRARKAEQFAGHLHRHAPAKVYKETSLECSCDPGARDYEENHSILSTEQDGGFVCTRNLLGRVCSRCTWPEGKGSGPEWDPNYHEWPCEVYRSLLDIAE